MQNYSKIIVKVRMRNRLSKNLKKMSAWFYLGRSSPFVKNSREAIFGIFMKFILFYLTPPLIIGGILTGCILIVGDLPDGVIIFSHHQWGHNW